MYDSLNLYWVGTFRLDEVVNTSTYFEIGKELQNAGFTFTLLCGYRNSNRAKRLKKSKINVKLFQASGRSGVFKLSLMWEIFRWLRKNAKSNSIVIIRPENLWLCAALKRLTKANFHIEFRTLPVEVNCLKDRVDYLFSWLIPIKLFGGLPSTFSFINRRLMSNVQKQFKLNISDYVLWEPGANVSLFENVAGSGKKRGFDDYTLFYHGSVTKNRGIDRVIRALWNLRHDYSGKIKMRIVGSGRDIDWLKRLCTELGLTDSVKFVGQVPYEEIPFEIAKADCCISPLPNRVEWCVSSPIKVFEYLASSKPVILTPISAHEELLSGNDFVVWTKGDSVSDFARAIEYAYNNHDTLTRNAEKGIDFIKKKYEWKVQAAKLAGYLKGRYRNGK
jgi:glycosyltransferase involved in cell wall biosynthesis